jgi:hypothetical protein
MQNDTTGFRSLYMLILQVIEQLVRLSSIQRQVGPAATVSKRAEAVFLEKQCHCITPTLENHSHSQDYWEILSTTRISK